MLHRQALASKTSSDLIQTVLEQMLQISNFIKAGVLNSRAFKRLCNDMDLRPFGVSLPYSNLMAFQRK